MKCILLLLKRSNALGGGCEPIGHGGEIVIFVELGDLAFSRRTLLTALRQSLSRLSRGDQSEVMLSVLQVVFGGDGIAPSMGVARQLNIFFRDMLRISANLHIWAVQFVGAR